VVYDWNVSIVVISLLFACFLPLYLLSDEQKTRHRKLVFTSTTMSSKIWWNGRSIWWCL